jgi:hypothetical protein
MTRFSKSAAIVTIAFAAYAGALIALRPWHSRWGATDEEVAEQLPGDEFAPRGAVCNHAITIEAPVSEVWRWMVQIGQDRAGFYSYSWLESLFLADIHNADRIVPEWQQLKVGDFVRLASKRHYGDAPRCRVLALEPNHYLVLERWGAFVLRPVNENAARLIIRTHKGDPLGGKLVNFFFWDLAHFIMERKMLLGIKQRAEAKRLLKAA